MLVNDKQGPNRVELKKILCKRRVSAETSSLRYFIQVDGNLIKPADGEWRNCLAKTRSLL